MSSPADVLTTRFGDGLATGTDLDQCAEAAVQQALAPLGGQRPDLLCVFVCSDNPAEVETAGLRAMQVTDAGTTLGCSAGGVLGAGRGVESERSVSAFAACLPAASCRPFQLQLVRTAAGAAVTGMPDRHSDDAVVVLLADPATFPVAAFVQRSNDDADPLPFIGGMASGPVDSGSARLFMNGETVAAGAVGAVLGGPVAVQPVVSQGCRPFGPPMVVTKAEGNVLLELAGTPALTKLE